MNNFIDLHNHVLPIDDGAQNDQDSLKMLYDAVESNISTVFVTPHMIPKGRYNPSVEEINKAFEHTKELIESNNIPIDLRIASEFMINLESMHAIDNHEYICYEGTRYLLVEFMRKNIHFGIIDDTLNELSSKGIKIIIAHPERYFDSSEEALEMAYKWVKQGYYLQVNRTSLLKQQNPLQRRIAFKLINANYVHLIASDAHRTTGTRIMELRDSYSIIKRFMGKECAELLHKTNQERLILDKDLESMHKIARGYKMVLKFMIDKLY